MKTAKEILQRCRGHWGAILSVLAPQLRPGLERNGRHVPCPVHGGKDGFRFFNDFEETGGSVCNTCGIHHDGISTLMWANGWGFKHSMQALLDFFNLNANAALPISPPKPVKTALEKKEEIKKMGSSLNRMWESTIPFTHRDAEPGRLYLARRGISIPAPKSLRFHPSLAYYEEGKKIGEYPAIVVMFSSSEGKPVTIHRLYLTKDGKKAPVESSRKMMKFPKEWNFAGGAIRLTDAPINVLAVAEGLETALAVREGTGLPVWCTANAYLLEHFIPPSHIDHVLVFSDKDRSTKEHPDGHGQEASRHLIKRLWGMGIKATGIIPSLEIKEGEKSVDWLDVLNQCGVAGFPTLNSVQEAVRRVA
jgi:phage/plasmid primase-like uncharacterized protein